VHNRSFASRVLVAIDGHGQLRAGADEPINISVSNVCFPLVQPQGFSYFSVVRSKLKWSGGAAEREPARRD